MDRAKLAVPCLISLYCLTCLSTQSRSAWADESFPSGGVPSAGAGGEESGTGASPAIPYRVLNEAISGFGREVVVLTDEQKRAIAEIRSGSHKIPMLCHQVKAMGSDSQSTLFDTAVRLVEQDEEDKVAHRILAVLSKEQIGEIRSRKRGAILQAESQRLTRSVPKPPAYHQTMYSVGSYLSRKDLLSLLQGTDALDLLQLSDEQFDAVQTIREQAWLQAMTTAKECVEQLRMAEEQKQKASQAVPADGGPIQKILDKTMAVLSEEQRVIYRTRVEKRHKELQENPPKDPLEMMAAFRQHAMPEEIRTVINNGHSQISIRLFNYFAVPQNATALDISAEQQQEIAALLKEAEQVAEKSMMESQKKSQDSDAANHAQVSEIVSAFHKKNFDQIFALLTERQIQILQEKKLQQLGLEALRLPEVRHELKLTETQVTELDAILNGRMSQQNSIAVISDAETRKLNQSIPKTPEEARKQFEEHQKEFNAQIAENQKRFQEFAEKRHREIWNLLTQEQRDVLTKLTGVVAPRDANPRI